ncbi:MAG: MFS transporter [Pseudomonadota bacterium]
MKLPKEIWALGLVSLLMDVASETIHGLLPVFLVSVLGASVTSLGFLEGLSQGTALVLKVLSGPFSDWLKKRKPVVVTGYLLGALSKPLFAMAHSIGFVYVARLIDRMGKGIRGAPRDALIGDIVDPTIRGKAYGLRQSLDTAGAFIGPVIAIFLMWISHNNYRFVFWFAPIPAFLAVLLLVFGVKEPEVSRSHNVTAQLSFRNLRQFGAAFWWVVGVGSIFQLARFSEAFLILRTKELGLGLEWSPLVLIVMNLVYSFSAYPAGHLSDLMKRDRILIVGLAVLILSNLVLALSSNLISVFFGIALWGLHMGLTQGILAALVSDHSPAYLRGTAYGFFNLASALSLLLASTLAGILWDEYGSKTTFLVSAGFSLLSLVFWHSRCTVSD